MNEAKFLACPFCGTEESERDGVKGIQHKEDCYIILMETELPNSPLRIMAWNRRAGGREPAMSETGGTKGVGMSDLLGAVVKFIQGKLADSKRTLKCREDMQKVWSEGTDESWRAVGNRMTKAQRLIESDMHGRIAAKNRKEMDMFKATLSALQQAPNAVREPSRTHDTQQPET